MGHLQLPRLSRTLARNVLIALVALDLAVLAGFSVRVDSTTTRTTTTPASVPVTAGVPAVPIAPAPVPPAVPLGNQGVPIADVTDAAPTPKPGTSKPTPPTDRPEPTQPAGSTRFAACPVHLGENSTDGGLQSLIGFAPAFGPFSAEAFAMASAYQPALQLIGPILAKYPALAPQLEPLLTPFLSAWQQVLDQGFALLGPLYSPYRTSVLQAETTLAATLSPYVQKLTSSPVGGCLVELQNALLHDASQAG